MILPILIQFRHIIGYGLAILALVSCVWYIFNSACDAKIVKETVIKYEKRNHIANNRPDVAGVIDELRRGQF